MPHFYTTNCGLIPHSLRKDLPILIFIDDFIYSRSPYLQLSSSTICDFISKKPSTSIYGLRGRETKTGNYKLKREKGEFLFKKEQFGDFFKYHEIKKGILVDNLESLNEHINSEDFLFIDLKGFLKPLEVIKFNKQGIFEYTGVSEYLRLLYKNREINYFMEVVEITINEIEKVLN